MANQILLSLGSNLGNRRDNLQQAIYSLGEHLAVESISSIYETAPWGELDQPDFLNIALSGKTLLDPKQFLNISKEIEKDIGRTPGPRWGPRVIDIDLLFYNDLILEESDLSIPHPQITKRAFVMVPLKEIAPAKVDPRSGITVSELAHSTQTDSGKVNLLPGVRLRRPTHLAWGIKTYVMGIVNVTPDSFSGDGVLNEQDSLGVVVKKAIEFVNKGADIIDLGGESTRPGSQPISAEQERERVVPAVKAIRSEIDVPISIDTYRADVASPALGAGADWINDVWGLRMDPKIAYVAADTGCPVVIMHNRSKPKDVEQEERLGGRFVGVHYNDLLADIKHELAESVDEALGHGMKKRQIILDPGIGFGKTVEQNILLLRNLNQFRELGYPLLVGTSRKSFIGYTLNLPPEDRVEGTAATVAIAIDRGADIVRVHDVEVMARVAKMTDRIVREQV